MSISEIYGEFSKFFCARLIFAILTVVGCGKTQLAHTMSVIAQLPKVISSHFHFLAHANLKVGNGWS